MLPDERGAKTRVNTGDFEYARTAFIFLHLIESTPKRSDSWMFLWM